MTALTQDQYDYLIDKVSTGQMTTSEANVQKVRMMRVMIVTSPIPKAVRTDLNNAVKAGILKHKKKNDLYLPEAYYHPDFEYLVNHERDNHAKRILQSLSKVIVKEGEE